MRCRDAVAELYMVLKLAGTFMSAAPQTHGMTPMPEPGKTSNCMYLATCQADHRNLHHYDCSMVALAAAALPQSSTRHLLTKIDAVADLLRVMRTVQRKGKQAESDQTRISMLPAER